jgi:hypothetical protein
MLVYPEVEHQVEPGAVGEIVLVVARDDVRLPEQDRVSPTPLNHLPQLTQVLEVQLGGAAVRPRFLDDERDGIDAESGSAESQPVADDAVDLFAHPRVLHIQVGLKVVEAVEVPRPRPLVVRPG